MSIDFQWIEEKITSRSISDEEKEALTEAVTITPLKQGGLLINQDEPGGKLHILYQGSVRVEREEQGNKTHIATANTGDVIGDMTFFSGDTASAHVTASSDSVVYQISRLAFSRLMKKNPDLVYSLFAYMLTHAAQVIRHMNEEHMSQLQYIMGRRV
ncbi:MAG: cyclic nucleotide-binding domain-containing protein [Mariprofundaceae bacterium]|nr:cyclic nucleotide-binding domain-containing protein [Mariprofundaceae bacterium]